MDIGSHKILFKSYLSLHCFSHIWLSCYFICVLVSGMVINLLGIAVDNAKHIKQIQCKWYHGLEHRCRKGHIFLVGVNEITFTPCNFLEGNNAMLKSGYCIMGNIVYNLVLICYRNIVELCFRIKQNRAWIRYYQWKRVRWVWHQHQGSLHRHLPVGRACQIAV